MSGKISNAQINPQATTTKTTFSRQTTVSILINASKEDIWKVLTDAENYSDWNTTVISLKGKIAQREKIRLVSTLDPKRTFKLKIKEFLPFEKLVWGDGKGDRIYTLTEDSKGTIFNMTEKIGGLMFPLYSKYIPPFDKSFEQFADDLKTEAEKL
ncbi:MAG: SRPBCC domain-containing protein [Bacteroidota bacterium]